MSPFVYDYDEEKSFDENIAKMEYDNRDWSDMSPEEVNFRHDLYRTSRLKSDE
ncbi:MAG: hypothetical protein LBN01_00815 [Endomicrobium sp.]|nr:hypothetical protein [Endomicrobium sp.]